jgi:hypothetical protein
MALQSRMQPCLPATSPISPASTGTAKQLIAAAPEYLSGTA